MTARRRRAVACALGAFVVAVLSAVLSSNVSGFQRGLLLVLAVVWLAIGALCVRSALRSASADPQQVPDDAP